MPDPYTIRRLELQAANLPRGSYEWAVTQTQLGDAWNAREDGDPIENADMAILAFRNALTVFTREEHLLEWGKTHAGLATALKNRVLVIPSLAEKMQENPEERRERDIRDAMTSFENARSVFLQESYPDVWAMFTAELGTLHWKHQRPPDLDRAIELFADAVDVLDDESRTWALIAVNLAGALDERGDLHRAKPLYAKARTLLRKEGPRLEYARATANLARIHWRHGTQRDRTLRLLQEAAAIQEEEGALRDANRSLATAAKMLCEEGAFDEAAELYRRELTHVEILCSAAETPRRRVEIVREYSRDVDSLVHCLVRAGRAAEAMASSQRPPLAAGEIAALAKSSGSALVVLRVIHDGSIALVAFPTGEIEPIEIPTFRESDLHELVLGDNGFLLAYFSGHDTLELTREEAYERWSANAPRILATLYEQLLRPVHERLSGRAKHIVFVPGGLLALLPLHACHWQSEDGIRYLIDDFVISYAPSLTLLRRSAKPLDSFLALCDPENDLEPLPFAAWEGAELRELAGHERTVVLAGSDATKERFLAEARGRAVIDLSCHAAYFVDAPLDSSFALAGDDILTLHELIASRTFERCRLIVASGCETALSEPGDPAEERLGLAPMLLASGADAVWGSLWSVEDDCAALVAIRAFENLLAGASEAEALCNAQRWVRDATGDELLAFLASRRTPAPPELGAALRDERSKRPYAHVGSWAPMVCLGAPYPPLHASHTSPPCG